MSIGMAAMLMQAACAEIAAPPGNAAAVGQGYPPQQVPQQASPMRTLFASTIAAVLQTTSVGIATAISGGIVTWFAAKAARNGGQGGGYQSAGAQYPGTYYPSTNYPSTTGYSNDAAQYPNTGYASTNPQYPGSSSPSSSYPSSTYPSSSYPGSTYPQQAGAYPGGESQYPNNTGNPGTSGYPSSQYPDTTAQYPGASGYPNNTAQYPGSSGDPNGTAPYPDTTTYPTDTPDAYPSTNNAYGQTQVYDAGSGQLVLGSDNPYAAASTDSIYAGIAYEVHALSPEGHWSPINTATYEFRSGDQFMIYYRPSLPGRMQVFNVNPAGQETQIDASDMAAGQIAGLGPYEFTNMTGDESLHLVLEPCSTPQLLVATRDIVKANIPGATDAQTGGGVPLSTCDAPRTRGLSSVRTRDIQKVAVEGTTSFALDQVSRQELASQQVESREVTIVFHHR